MRDIKFFAIYKTGRYGMFINNKIPIFEIPFKKKWK
jgi:hypothetical protein